MLHTFTASSPPALRTLTATALPSKIPARTSDEPPKAISLSSTLRVPEET